MAAEPGHTADLRHVDHHPDRTGGAGGIGWFIGLRANDEFPRLVEQVRATAKTIENWLYTGPLHLQPNQITAWIDEVTKQVTAQRNQITQTVLTGATVALEVLASIVLLLFVTFFLLKDGDRIWSWFLQAFGGPRPASTGPAGPPG